MEFRRFCREIDLKEIESDVEIGHVLIEIDRQKLTDLACRVRRAAMAGLSRFR
jgi:hypothetical protein